MTQTRLLVKSILTFFTAVELGIFFLNVPFTLFRRVLRVIFYVSFPLVVGVTLMFVLLTLTWIFIGALQQVPTQSTNLHQ
jgi:uncharacterized membrane protein YGL010W